MNHILVICYCSSGNSNSGSALRAQYVAQSEACLRSMGGELAIALGPLRGTAGLEGPEGDTGAALALIAGSGFLGGDVATARFVSPCCFTASRRVRAAALCARFS